MFQLRVVRCEFYVLPRLQKFQNGGLKSRYTCLPLEAYLKCTTKQFPVRADYININI